jgi:hypothetical protein
MGISNEGANKGMQEFLTVAHVLSNADALAAEYRKLSDAREQAQKVIDLVGPAEDILRMRASIDNEQTAATEALRAARTRAEGIASMAKLEASRTASAAQAAADAVRAEAEKTTAAARVLMDDATARARALDGRQAALDSALQAATAREDAASRAIEAADKEKKALEGAREALRAAGAQIAAFVDQALNGRSA